MSDKPNKTDVADLVLSVNVMQSVNNLTTWYLSIVGMFYLLIGVTWIVFHSPSREAGLVWLDFLSPTATGVIWMVVGLLGVIASCIESHKLNRVAFFLMIMIPGVLGFYFFVSWFLYITPFISIGGTSSTITASVSYWAFSAASYIMARTYEVTTVKNRRGGGVVSAS